MHNSETLFMEYMVQKYATYPIENLIYCILYNGLRYAYCYEFD